MNHEFSGTIFISIIFILLSIHRFINSQGIISSEGESNDPTREKSTSHLHLSRWYLNKLRFFEIAFSRFRLLRIYWQIYLHFDQNLLFWNTNIWWYLSITQCVAVRIVLIGIFVVLFWSSINMKCFIMTANYTCQWNIFMSSLLFVQYF